MNSFPSILRAVSYHFDQEWPEDLLIDKRYRIQTFLGMGSYGISYLVTDVKTNKSVVLKRLRFRKRIWRKGREGFIQEMQMLNFLHSSAFPQVYDRGVFRNSPYFTMQYINGKTFEQLIFEEEKQFTEFEALSYSKELLLLIHIIHEAGIIHRDLRIPNIMLEDGRLKIIDFGLARWKDDPSKDKYIGTPKAIAPESDYFQLGHFLLFLLYSRYEPDESAKELPWQEELEMMAGTKELIERLFSLRQPFQSTDEILQSIESLLVQGG